MIRVTKDPDPVHCSRCGCEFIYDKNDIHWSYDIINKKSHADIRCPICNKIIEL